ncbi:hypothetical protein A3A76_05460 [Candidatus Woesebacteria bacterium RIFCSPLOWO2_01_FULL_39_23]|uniref:Non-canonical purine NTP pyrophosphatase n=1 Tax=Candidatus Woesebacteria bacterium RIFCSPHIGHO2_01_FULL_40_22 TaxID=1802499 RepID=A0A1F7YKU7_9BACT|nr:MAG: hypothetical protein A2141_03850 [Candidatus Woesebacteria bacterium RBG_16_40_11]OGM27902.1 MAG: hypothetical protein A2628_03385 [Candidatus Woesebacteria bacterium RIFCSPHIGHO2_01_FULL_40_22]OGM38140.1 MAG: hypothetical protein A3E41_00945 [Candidatus Woesebacteria bacterium RIFCSPHIGHO2_12_FULL_38_9]OGM61658.1 MAG: hypothetical protein A3A76_05460 [Candidatus Woesebacteria bacterium RIFCSPLOWO2_01_FULL_39_23]
MKSVYFATSNSWKFNLAKRFFEKQGIALKQFDIDVPESRSEEGEIIAKEKANFAFAKLRKPLFVLDGSFQVRTLNNFPKTFIKMFDKYIGAEGLLKLVQDKVDRYWELLNILCYKDNKNEKVFIGVQKGQVVKKLTHNKKGLIRDFDRVLVPDGYDKTFAEFKDEEIKEYDNNVWPEVFDKFIDWYKQR